MNKADNNVLWDQGLSHLPFAFWVQLWLLKTSFLDLRNKEY